MTNIVEEINNFHYPNHITQSERDKHRIVKYKHHTLGLQIEMYERAMNTVIETSTGLVPLPLPPLDV